MNPLHQLAKILPQPLQDLLYLAALGQLAPRPRTYDRYDQLRWYLGYSLRLDRETIITLLNEDPLPPRYRYRHFTIPKKNGQPRHITAPGPDLKQVQRRLLKRFLRRPKPHPAATAFQKGKSIATHAWTHAGQNIIITADIQDFFPNTSSWRINHWWQDQNYDDDQALLLTRLTTYLGALPQGAPTSPALSNLVNHPLDVALARRAAQSGGRYTRYADDLVFSWARHQRPPSDFRHGVITALRQHGYNLHPHKGWGIWHKADEPIITGLVLKRNGRVDLPPSLKKAFQELEKRAEPAEQQRLNGYRGYYQMIQNQ
ncbi:MAG TPA: reverse transcriptase family protein [Anaerolineae bacterium]|nr:reverse transcriptase family protein [Anaerolineae bacterium]